MVRVETIWIDFRDAVLRARNVQPKSVTEDFAKKCFYAGVQAMIGYLEPKARAMSRYEFLEELHILNDDLEVWIEELKRKRGAH